MKILCVDYGRRKIGLALGDTESKLAEPLKVIKFENEVEGLHKVEQAVQVEQAERVVVGMSEGQMGFETQEFGKKLAEKLHIPVDYQDETLSTQEAQRLAIEAGIRRKKRKALDDAYSAAIILQDYLDGI